MPGGHHASGATANVRFGSASRDVWLHPSATHADRSAAMAYAGSPPGVAAASSSARARHTSSDTGSARDAAWIVVLAAPGHATMLPSVVAGSQYVTVAAAAGAHSATMRARVAAEADDP